MSHAHSVWRLRHWLAPYRWQVARALGCALLSAAATVLVPVVISRVVIDELLLHVQRRDVPSFGQRALTHELARSLHLSPLMAACALVLLWGLLWAGLGYTYRVELSAAANAALRDQRADLFACVSRLPPSFYDHSSVGQVLTCITNDIESLTVLALGLGMLIGECVPFLVAVTVMFTLDATLLCELTPTLALGAIAISLFKHFSRTIYQRLRDRSAHLNAHLHEHLSGIETVQLAGREARNARHFQSLNEAQRATEAQAIQLETIYNPTMECIPTLAIAASLWIGGHHVLGGSATLGTVVLFLQFSDMLIRPVIVMGDQANAWFRAGAACRRIFGLLDRPDALARPARFTALPARLRGAVEYRDLTFHYPGGAQPAIRQLSLNVAAGQTLAIVGPTGSGKTTLTRLLCRLYDAPPGSVFIDGVDVMAVDPALLRKRIGVIMQDFHIFAGTIYDNIALGDPHVTRERARSAAALVHAAHFIDALPQGLDTVLQDRGQNLSHGQRQLLAFARVLARDPEILILDEATASIDPETEAQIQAAIASAVAKRTAIVVAHRLQTIRDADRIAVIDGGRLVELGDHEQLIARNHLYAKLYRLGLARAQQAPPADGYAAHGALMPCATD